MEPEPCHDVSYPAVRQDVEPRRILDGAEIHRAARLGGRFGGSAAGRPHFRFGVLWVYGPRHEQRSSSRCRPSNTPA